MRAGVGYRPNRVFFELRVTEKKKNVTLKILHGKIRVAVRTVLQRKEVG
jgi:hypothetical protein